MKKLLRQAAAMIAIIALAVTLLPLSALAEAKTSFVRSQIDSHPAKPHSEAAKGIEIVPHKTENPKRSEVWDGSIAEGFSGGAGTQEDPYLISNGSELAYLALEVNIGSNYSGVYFKLTNDIYLNDTSNWESWGDGVAPQNEWTAIGIWNTYEETVYIFNGRFNGNGYAVHGIYINNQEDYQGLFGYIGEGSVIANLGVAESYICGFSCIGGVVGFNEDGNVTNCYNTCSIIGEESIGGVVGFNEGGNVIDCHNEGSISGYYSGIGGVVGANSAYVENCYNAGYVTCEYGAGGVVGENIGTVTDCYNEGWVNGVDNIGGVVGWNTSLYDYELEVQYNALVANCYNIGNVSGGDSSIGGGYSIGGVVGSNDSSTVTDCYNTGNVIGEECIIIGGVVGENFSYYDYEIDANFIATVSNCYNTGNILGYNRVGGVIGENTGTITDCYNTGSISGVEDSVGGVIGRSYGWYNEGINDFCDAIVTNCYNVGSVSGTEYIGGVVGDIQDSTVTNCYYLNTCCDSENEYGTALTDEQMQASESFIGFDFVEVWTMDGNPDYPYPELVGNIHGGMPAVTTEPGDANGDGKITIADATLISRMALNLTESVPAADFNGDGSINIADATLTARKALNLI